MNQERKNILISFARPMAIVIVSIAVVVFGYARIKSQSAEAARLQNEFALLISKSDSQLSLRQDYANAKPEMVKLEQALPTTDELQKIADTITLTAINAGNGISLRLISQLESASKDANFDVRMNGTADSLFSFLSQLEKLPYFIETRDFSVSFSGGFTGNIESGFSLKVYLR